MYRLAAFAPGLWSSSLAGCGHCCKTPSLPSYVPWLCRLPPQWLCREKGPCLCPFSLHRGKRKVMAFSVNAPGCELLWVRNICPTGSLVAGDLWRGVRLTAVATTSAASSPKIIFSYGAVLRKNLVLLLFRSDHHQWAASRRVKKTLQCRVRYLDFLKNLVIWPRNSRFGLFFSPSRAKCYQHIQNVGGKYLSYLALFILLHIYCCY